MYEESSGSVTDTLKSASPEVFSASTIEAILSLTTGTGDTSVNLTEVTAAASGEVTVASGTEIAYVTAPANTELLVAQDIPVVLFQGTTGVNVNFNAPAQVGSAAGIVDRIVVGTAGNDKIVIADAKNTQITAGAGDTIVAGAGSDTIIAGMGDSTISGGSGFAIVQLAGNANDYGVTVVDGKAVVTGNGSSTTIDSIQYIAVGNGDALILAKDEIEAAVSTLYETTFGRAADAYGLQFWFDMARAGVSLNAIANGFVSSAEYASSVGSIDNATFVNNLFKQTYGHDASAADLAEWTAKLSSGSDRADLIEQFAATAGELIADGSGTEVVGSVVIIPGIFG